MRVIKFFNSEIAKCDNKSSDYEEVFATTLKVHSHSIFKKLKDRHQSLLLSFKQI